MFEPDYMDGEESRSWELLKDIDRRKAIELYPDFDVSYLRAAYITPSIDDHHMAEVEVLKQGLQRSIRKSEILARLSCWHAWNCEANEFAYGSAATSVKFAVHALVAGELPTGPGSKLQAFLLIAELMRYVDPSLADDLRWKGPRGKLAERQQREVRYAAETCVRSFPEIAQRARDVVKEVILPRF